MKIYFAGSIAGGRQDAGLYRQIIALLKQYGDVLTEHIGNIDLDDKGEADLARDVIFKRDVEWLEQSDWIVAEVTNPSLGVGYELGISEKLDKHVLCLFREQDERRLSPMVEGNNNFNVVKYKTVQDLETIFIKYLSL